MHKIAVGPILNQPSWRWVGFDVARELGKYYSIELFRRDGIIPDVDLVFVVKHPPPTRFARELRARGKKLVYAPIDYFSTTERLCHHRESLQLCDLIVSHCERLNSYLDEYAKVQYIDHHGRSTLTDLPSYREDGFVLWIGQICYVPWLLFHLSKYPIPFAIKILTGMRSESGISAAQKLASKLKIEFSMSVNSICGYSASEWTEYRQYELMSQCKAAIDIKGGGGEFGQQTKPATKVQQFVSSGIPCAVNPDSYSAEYFLTRDFNVASPDEQERWFSRGYWEETQEVAKVFRPFISLPYIGKQYRSAFEHVLSFS
jgi:hypothetical protein